MLEHDTVNREYFVEAILDGDADSFLDAISGAIKSRRATINEKKFFSFKPGDIVKFNSLVRPKYLRGLEAEVVSLKQKNIEVKIVNADSRARRYAYGNFTTPVSLVDKVEA